MIRLTAKNREFIRASEPPQPPAAEDIIPYPQVTATNPMSFGADFNLVRAVEEYAPLRISTINDEIEALQRKIAVLSTEKDKLSRLVEAL